MVQTLKYGFGSIVACTEILYTYKLCTTYNSKNNIIITYGFGRNYNIILYVSIYWHVNDIDRDDIVIVYSLLYSI